jgi:beta-galactosidase/beta-glucuronidase
MSIPRSEYPRPQFVRDQWLCLNGEWQFEIDHGDSGVERGLRERELAQRIQVPFCPESSLSGVEYTDFMAAVWYRREVAIPADWQGKDVLLHFQAVDYDATVWVNGVEVARHRGGFAPITCELRGIVAPGETATIVVRARDDHRAAIPKGKQSDRYQRYGCHYTRTTGIWQTVWMEPVTAVRLLRPRITPDLANTCFRLVQPITNTRPGYRLQAVLLWEGLELAREEVAADTDFAPQIDLAIPADAVNLWSPGEGNLYDIELTLLDPAGKVVDQASTYAGLRSVTIEGTKVKINGESVFQRLVLDQGYYPDGILTAPSDEALVRDIQMSMEVGFNGARLHQKVFEERFLYHADRLGYLVWGEFADWCAAGSNRQGGYGLGMSSAVVQWLEVVGRDFSHPAIVGWCPLNETHCRLGDHIESHDDLMLGMFLAAKAMDPTRPVLDTSGYSHRVPQADIYDCHDYAQDPEVLRKNQAGLAEGNPYTNKSQSIESIPYRGQPFFVSEFGGTWWNPEAAKEGRGSSWGYGERPTTIEEFYARFEALCNVLLDDPNMFGYCYTQITDVFQEQNGIFFFDRSAKFDAARLNAIQTRQAAIEK